MRVCARPATINQEKQIKAPADFDAVVITSPRDVSANTIPFIQALAEKLGLPRFRGHRILFASQIENCDSSAVAAMLTIMRSAQSMGHEFAICNPSPIVRRYLEIYGAATYLEGRVLYSDENGFFQSELLPFVPPYVPADRGRWDIYRRGQVQSMIPTAEGAIDIPPVNLNNYAVAAYREVVHRGGKTRVLARVQKQHEAFLQVRRYNFPPEMAASKLDALHRLHDWYRRKGFDFRGLFLWQHETQPGQLTCVLAFRDRSHFEQFQTLLKVDSDWKPLAAPLGEPQVEFHKLF